MKACLFDVFGTVVDWRTSVSRDLAAFGREKGIGDVDWLEFAVEWRKRAGLPWDCVLGAETARAYKPMPEAYLAACPHLTLPPGEVMMVAAHNADLKAAKEQGLATAFVARPTEHGPGQTSDLAADPACVDVAATSFIDLAGKLAC